MAPTPDAGPGFGILRLDPASLLHYRRALGLRSDRSALIALARAIAASPGGPAAATFVVRPDPEPVLGISAEGLDPARLRLQLQLQAAAGGVGRLRYIGYGAAEAAVERLATQLVERFGGEAVRRFRYAPLPRGGLVVLGLLASRLGLPVERLARPLPEEDAPLVVVDDCALSGGRFAAFLQDCPARQVIFAPLWSPPALRAAIEAAEPRVLACLAAHDLEDGDAAREAWRQRLQGPRYGPGTGDRIAFPWNEPDRVVWNPETGEVELGWKLVPPELCLKQRAGVTTRPRIQVQPRGRGPWRPASTVLFVEQRQETVVQRLDTGEVFRLPGTAHSMWRALLRSGDPAAASRLLLSRYHVAPETLEADLASFLRTLRERGLVEVSESS